MVSVFVLPTGSFWLVRVTVSPMGRPITIRERVFRDKRTAGLYADDLRREWRGK